MWQSRYDGARLDFSVRGYPMSLPNRAGAQPDETVAFYFDPI